MTSFKFARTNIKLNHINEFSYQERYYCKLYNLLFTYFYFFKCFEEIVQLNKPNFATYINLF